MRQEEYEQNVFINCPFDPEYAPIFEAIVFAVNDAGFRPTCARERLDSSQIRLHKIVDLISSSRYSIHDLSRTTLDDAHALPRFNMPLELGIDLGCKAYKPECADKSLLIFDSEQYRFQKFVSDLGGQDIHQHGNSPKRPSCGFGTGSARSRQRPPFQAERRFSDGTRCSVLTCRKSVES
jgi:hypothetical protein